MKGLGHAIAMPGTGESRAERELVCTYLSGGWGWLGTHMVRFVHDVCAVELCVFGVNECCSRVGYLIMPSSPINMEMFIARRTLLNWLVVYRWVLCGPCAIFFLCMFR